MFRGQDGEVAKPGMGVQASPKGMSKLGSACTLDCSHFTTASVTVPAAQAQMYPANQRGARVTGSGKWGLLS